MLAALLLLLASPALESARQAFAKGRLDEVVFALQRRDAVDAAEAAQAGGLLADAALRARESGDQLLALQLAQMAVARDPGESRALELLSGWALQSKEFGQAYKYAAAWARAHPDDAAAKRALERVEAADKKWRPIRIDEVHKRSRPAAPLTPSITASAAAAGEHEPGSTSAGSAHFRIVYMRGTKDWAERSRYEVTALQLFERAWVDARGQLGEGLVGPFEVLLYTHEEFSQRFGRLAGGHVLGFYAGKIRMNLSETLDERFHATALHELVHAALDQLARGRGDRLPMWLNEGTARWVERKALSGDVLSPREHRLVAAQGLALPLSSLARTSFAQLGAQAELAYAKSAAAVAALVSGGEGIYALTRVVRALGEGSSFDAAFAAEFGKKRLASLDEEARKAAIR